MANRTTVKSNITTKCVPSVTNAIMIDMLNNEMADNLKFREDVATVQNSTVSAITCDFTGKDRIDLTRTGGGLNIAVAGIGDGETKSLLVTKTAGQAITFIGVTDITPIIDNILPLTIVLYDIIRKGAYYYAKAWVDTVLTGTTVGKIPIIGDAGIGTLGAIITKSATGIVGDTFFGLAATAVPSIETTLVTGKFIKAGSTGLVSGDLLDYYGSGIMVGSGTASHYTVTHNLNIPVENQVILATSVSGTTSVDTITENSFRITGGYNGNRTFWHLHDTR